MAERVPPPGKPLVVSPKEACRITSFSKNTVDRKIASGELESRKIGARRVVVYASIERLLGVAGQDQHPA